MEQGAEEREVSIEAVSRERLWTLETQNSRLLSWIDAYISLAFAPFHEKAATMRELHRLVSFGIFCRDHYGTISITSVHSDAIGSWERELRIELGEMTIAAYLESLRRFLGWVRSFRPDVTEPVVAEKTSQSSPATTPLAVVQIRALKDTARRGILDVALPQGNERPFRDRAILLLLLELGLGREEVVAIKRGAVEARTPRELYAFLEDEDALLYLFGTIRKGISQELRHALTEYILMERGRDGGSDSLEEPLFLSVMNRPRRSHSGGLSQRAVNLILEGLVKKHNAQASCEDTRIASLTPRVLKRSHDEYYAR